MVGRKEEEGHHCVYAADVATQVPMLRGTLLLAAVTPATFAWWGLPATKAACPIRLDSGEIRLDLTIRGLFADDIVPASGSIIDAGANRGEELCQYADLAPYRTVHGVEPLSTNLDHIKRTWVPGRRNIQLHQGVLGPLPGYMQVAAP